MQGIPNIDNSFSKKSAASTSTMSFVQFVRMTPRFAYWAELK